MNPILVPLRNGLALTRAAHKTFLTQDVEGGVDLLYIDNNSSDGTAQFLAATGARVATNRIGKSVAASWNQGLSWFFGRSESHVLVVNNDVELLPQTYRCLVESGHLFVTAVGSADRMKLQTCNPVPDPAMIRPHPDFSCFLMRREVWERVGPFNEAYVGAYGEDSEYHLRMHRAGIRAVAIELPFYHVACGTLKNATEAEAARIAAKADANRARFMQQYGVAVGSAEYYALFGHGAPDTSPE